MNGMLDWQVFAFKFRGNPQVAFETLAYHMFCRTFNITEGLPAFYNQKHIETDPYQCDDGRIVGFQAKYYSTPSISAEQMNVLKETIEDSAATYKGLNLLYFYLSRPFSQSSSFGKTKTKMQMDLEERANSLGIEIKWVVPSCFEMILNEQEYLDIKEYFFDLGKSEHSKSQGFFQKQISELMKNASTFQRTDIFKGSNKFSGLDIFEDLIPLAVSEKGFDEPIGIDSFGIERPLYDYFTDYKDEHLMLIGEGGIGKTTFLAHLMKKINSDDCPAVVPIYIELNCCPPEIGDWYVDKEKKTNFILRYIASLIDHRDLDQYSLIDLQGIEQELNHQSDTLYLLLLDGFNEVNLTNAVGKKAGMSVRELLQQEITSLCKCSNVRIILTTREMTDGYLPIGLKKIRLKGLEDKKIAKYLRDSHFSETDIKWILTNRSLMECLRIPLFLCMFACRNQYENIHPTTKGEILYHFFHRGTPFYSEKKRIKEVLTTHASEKKILSFIEDFMLPVIAYDMYSQGSFQMQKKKMINCVANALKDPLMKYASATTGFFDYETETSSLKAIYYAVKDEKVEEILNRCVNVLGIINSGTGKGLVHYAFIHHHIRDYFAAYYIVQRIRCALYYYAERRDEESGISLDQDQVLFMNVRGSLEPLYYERLDSTIRQFIGEILGEHRNVLELVGKKEWKTALKVFDEQDTLTSVLDMFRYQQADPRNTIYNIIEIFKCVRSSLSGADFNGLNLYNCCFYETICASGIDVFKVSASFRDCRISDQSFWFRGHLAKLRDIKVSTNDNLLFTYGEDDQVCIWELPSMFQRMHYATDIASYHEAHSPYQTEIVVSGLSEFMLPAYDEKVIDDEITTLSSKIVYYPITGDVLYLTEDGENREIMCMSFSCSGRILGIWGADTLRIFESERGRLCKTVRYKVQGETLGVIYTFHGQIVLQVRIQKESITNRPFLKSRWVLYLLEQDSGAVTPVLEFESVQSVMYSKNTPAFDVDKNGRFFVFYTNQALHLFDLTTMTDKQIWQFSEDVVPKWIQFLDVEASVVAIQWADKLLWLPISGGNTAFFENSVLSDTELCAFTKNEVFFVNAEGELFQWNLITNKVSDELIPRVKLGIKDIQQDHFGNLIVRYNNNCILTIDILQGTLIDSFFSNDNDSKIEASLFLNNINRQLIVLRTSEYEQILLYDNYLGIIQRIDIYSYERLKFVAAHSVETTLFVGFDKKVIAIDLLTMKQTEVWRQKAGELLFDMEVETEREILSVVMLLQWRMLSKKPRYTIMSGSVEKGFTLVGERDVEYIAASQMNDLVISNKDDIEYFGIDAITGQTIYTVRGYWKQSENPVLKRLFIFVKHPTSFINNAIFASNSYVLQFDENWIITIREYAEIGIQDKKTGNNKVIKITDSNNPNVIVQVLDGLMCQNHKLYCRTVEDKMIQVNTDTGYIERTFDFMPGIIVSGCDFTGSEISENMKQILIHHGALF